MDGFSQYTAETEREEAETEEFRVVSQFPALARTLKGGLEDGSVIIVTEHPVAGGVGGRLSPRKSPKRKALYLGQHTHGLSEPNSTMNKNLQPRSSRSACWCSTRKTLRVRVTARITGAYPVRVSYGRHHPPVCGQREVCGGSG